MNLRQGLEKLRFDVRMQELNVRTRTIKQDELTKHLTNLPDSATNSESFDVNAEGMDDDDDDLPSEQ